VKLNKRHAPVQASGNGHSHMAPALATVANGRSEIPLEGD
jgi:hypothetical protein